MTEILLSLLILSLIVSVYLSWLLTKNNREKNKLKQHQIEHRQTIDELILDNTKLKTQNQAYQQHIDFLKQSKSDINKHFEVIANQILEKNQQKLSKNNKQSLEPLQVEIKQFKERIETITAEQIKERTSLIKELENLQKATLNTQKTTENLTNALTKDSKQQGNWGEIVLDSILSASGLREGFEFDKQISFKNTQGNLLRPDVVVHLPDNKDIIIDAKVSLKAYEQYIRTNQPSDLKQHIQSIKKHIDSISIKAYEQLENVKTIDFIFIFMPIEPALLLALKNKEDLFTNAMKKNIMLTSPSTLTMSLKIVHHLWQTERQNKNTIEIIRQAGQMYDKFVLFNQSLAEIGKHLDQAQASQQKAQSRLNSGAGNLISRAEKLKELGVQPSKRLA